MNQRRKGKKNKDVFSKLTKTGASRLRADMKAANFVGELKGETVELMQYSRSILFPWSVAKLKYALQRPVTSLEQGYQEAFGAVVPMKTYLELFRQNIIFKRLAANDYEKKVSRDKVR